MTKASPTRKAKKKVDKKGNSGKAPQAAAQQPQQLTQEQQQKLMEEQDQFFSGLFQMAQDGTIPEDKKTLVEMLAESQQKIHGGRQNLEQTKRRIYDLQVQQQQLTEAITREEGTARGISEALWRMRDQIDVPDATTSTAEMPLVDTPSEEETLQ